MVRLDIGEGGGRLGFGLYIFLLSTWAQMGLLGLVKGAPRKIRLLTEAVILMLTASVNIFYKAVFLTTSVKKK